MPFDPDKYLASKQSGGGFDPDAYLAKRSTKTETDSYGPQDRESYVADRVQKAKEFQQNEWDNSPLKTIVENVSPHSLLSAGKGLLGKIGGPKAAAWNEMAGMAPAAAEASGFLGKVKSAAGKVGKVLEDENRLTPIVAVGSMLAGESPKDALINALVTGQLNRGGRLMKKVGGLLQGK